MTLEELTPWLFERTAGGIRWGLDRTIELLAGVGDPHRQFRSVHIGGTNGKGSVAAICDAVLRAGPAASRVGLYTSPHLVSFAERIRIDGTPAPDLAIAQAAELLRPAIERSGATFFEATTAIAFLCFARAGVDLAVVEVGLGGRLDSTNVLHPLVTGVTNVGLDHTEYLGGTLREIAAEKAGIFKAGVPAVTTEARAEPLEVLRSAAEKAGAPFTALDAQCALRGVRTGLDGTRFDVLAGEWAGDAVSLPLVGEHQAANALLAMELLARLPAGSCPDRAQLVSGLAAVRWPGRCQVERIGSTTWVLDVAHNAEGARALAGTLAGLDVPRPLVLLASILADKPWPDMLAALLPLADGTILTTAPSAPAGRRWDLDGVEGWARGAGARNVRVIPALEDALSRATTLAPHGTVLVTGSVHTVGDALKGLGVAVV
jgi:dihydrofolate synthase / folylpolyglutamate synthase